MFIKAIEIFVQMPSNHPTINFLKLHAKEGVYGAMSCIETLWRKYIW